MSGVELLGPRLVDRGRARNPETLRVVHPEGVQANQNPGFLHELGDHSDFDRLRNAHDGAQLVQRDLAAQKIGVPVPLTATAAFWKH